jgi:hypothetical protein
MHAMHVVIAIPLMHIVVILCANMLSSRVIMHACCLSLIASLLHLQALQAPIRGCRCNNDANSNNMHVKSALASSFTVYPLLASGPLF